MEGCLTKLKDEDKLKRATGNTNYGKHLRYATVAYVPKQTRTEELRTQSSLSRFRETFLICLLFVVSSP